MKTPKYIIVTDIISVVINVACFLALLLTGSFKDDNDIVAVGLLVSYWLMAVNSLRIDLISNIKRPTFRTIGLFIMGILLLLGFVEEGHFDFIRF